jgi:hypothetical protein
LGAFCQEGKFAFFESMQKDEFFDTRVGQIQSQKFHFWFLGILNLISARNGSKFRKTYFVE